MTGRVSISAKIREDFKRDIIAGKYGNDELITESMLSEKYNVSKTPAREALNSLLAEGLIEKIPNVGYFLKRYSADDIAKLLYYRYILERGGIELSMKVASDREIAGLRKLYESDMRQPKEVILTQFPALNQRFHVGLIALAHNKYMTAALSNTLSQLNLALYMDYVNHNYEALDSHAEIIEALEARDLDRGLQWVTSIIRNLKERIIPEYSA